MSMNITQQLFVVFFAICWGTSSNAWPRWKPFHWTLIGDVEQAWRRVKLSMLLLNALPIIYFAVVLGLLRSDSTVLSPATIIDWIRDALAGILPAFAVFGFYRIWFGIIESNPSRFYLTKGECSKDPDLDGIEPTIEDLKIRHRWWRTNVVFGALYVVPPLLVALAVKR